MCVGIAVFLAAGKSISTRDAYIYQIADAIATTNDINTTIKKKKRINWKENWFYLPSLILILQQDIQS